MCADAPDTTGINAAAQVNAEVAKDALAFYKEQYAEQAPTRDAAAAVANQVSNAQLEQMNTQTAIAKEANDYQNETFRPLEKQIVGDASNYDTPERREAAAGAAAADVSSAAASARAQTARAQASMGVNPNSGRMAALDAQTSVAQAASTAGAMKSARDTVETQGYARKMDAANLGRGLSSAQATSAQIATTAGNSAVQNATTPVSLAQGGVAMMGQGYQAATSANSASGQLYGAAANASKTEDQTGQLVGSAVGAAAMFF